MSGRRMPEPLGGPRTRRGWPRRSSCGSFGASVTHSALIAWSRPVIDNPLHVTRGRAVEYWYEHAVPSRDNEVVAGWFETEQALDHRRRGRSRARRLE